MPLFLLLLLILSPALHALETGQYDVQLDVKSGLVEVEACLAHPTKYLTTGSRASARYLISFSQQQKPLATGSRIKLLPGQPLCFQYEVDLKKASLHRQSYYQEQSWLVDMQSWLWLPIEDIDLKVSFNQAVSVPWPKFSKGQYKVNTETAFWPSRMAFGQLHQHQLKLDQQNIRLDLLGHFDHSKQQQLKQWLQDAATAVSSIYQSFPVSHIQLLVLKAQRGTGPVPWGEVQRGSYPAVHLFINPQYELARFQQDWTASHELSHLLLPKIHSRDRWLSEGVASYYQNIARANAGQLTPSQAWQKLSAGFRRGQKAGGTTPLRYAQKTMHIYWGGAAIFMLADMKLRQLTSPTTLALVLKRFQQCCLPNNRVWSSEQLMAKLDQLSKSKIFSQLLQQEAQAHQFPLANSVINGPLPSLLFSKSTDGN